VLYSLESTAFAGIHNAGMLTYAVGPDLNPVRDVDAADHQNDGANDFDGIGENTVIGQIIDPEIAKPSQEIVHSSSPRSAVERLVDLLDR
jgi:hypothetical protein